MKVELINHTPEPDRSAAHAALTCYSEDIPAKEKMSKEKIEEILNKIKESGHHSVIEHASFTFAIEDVSRTLTHQLVRHRLASYSQQSQRYVDIEDFDPVVPDTIKDSERAKERFDELMEKVKDTYVELKEMDDVPLEDARFVLPNATKTNIIVTMNARELWHFFSLRCCKRAQWEIREMANRMLELVKEKAPIIFEEAGAPCVRGPCPESEEFFCGEPIEQNG
ncbi:MAG: FAD-dependent thymidylate synthase [Candidatus Thermoplasmatota archaeon]|nr:FAD-dependent thymidylate synthase [Candidatus Thermoplasmatota archaeon]MBS3790398.1 FAD-dependent thymidylate synthase [Candidatus Thermoplasmatota archaeon]